MKRAIGARWAAIGFGVVGALVSGAAAQNVQFPAGAGFLNVLDFGAIPNDGMDDTAAFNAAFAGGRPGGTNARLVYVPDGIYDFSNTIAFIESRSVMQGQSRDGTILRLMPGSPGFNGPPDGFGGIVTKNFVSTRESPFFSANEFVTAVYDLTIEVGANNPGAVGLNFHCNNQGGIRNVRIRSLDPAGAGSAGLSMFGSDKGPGMYSGITVEGFRRGLQIAGTEYSHTFENLTLIGQTEVGIWNRWNLLAIRGLTSTNTVRVLESTGFDQFNLGWPSVVIVDGVFNGGSGANPALDVTGAVYLRNCTAAGYSALVRRDGVIVPGLSATEYTSQRALSVFRSAPTMLNLAVESTPEVPFDPPGAWVSVTSFGAVPNDSIDDSAAFQAAIDSGATTVYTPAGRYLIGSTVELRGNVRRLFLMQSFVESTAPLSSTTQPMFRTGASAEPVVIVERGNINPLGTSRGFEHTNARTLVLRNVGADRLHASGTGKVFVEDLVGGEFEFSGGVRAWLRQFNPENEGVKFTVDNADVWVLGYKTEKIGTQAVVRSGGRLEILGGLIYAVNDLPLEEPMFINDRGAFSVVIGESAYGPNSFYKVIVQERRVDAIRRLFFNEIPRRVGNGWGAQLAFYVGNDTGVPAPPAAGVIYPLDEIGGTVVPDAQGGASGSTSGGPAWVAGQIENALQFDGVNDHVDLPNGLGSSNVGAVSLWFNSAADFTDAGMLFYATSSANPNANGGGSDQEMHINFNANDTVSFFIEGSASPDVSMGSSAALNDGQWHHVVASWQNGGMTELFIDGKRVGATTQSWATFPWSVRTRLGRPAAASRWFNGLIDDVRIFNRPVQHDEAMDLYFGGLEFTNYPPAVDGGPDQIVQNATYSRQLGGQAVDDGQPIGTPLSVLWTQVSGPGEVSFDNASNPQAIATFTLAGTYVLRLTADDTLASDSDEITVFVYDPLPAPWVNVDVGFQSEFGWALTSQTQPPFQFEMNAGGFAIDGFPATGCDSFHYAYQTFSQFNNIEIRGRITAIENTNPNARSGFMFRQNLDSTCTANAFLGLTADGRLIFSNRGGSFGGTDVSVVATGLTPPVWLRLERENANQVRGFWSLDGSAWTDLGLRTVNTGSPFGVFGIAASAYAGTINTSTFDAVRVAPPACPGDADGDQMVGLPDVAAIINLWGQTVPLGTSADLDGDGTVGLGDLAAVINAWNTSCP